MKFLLITFALVGIAAAALPDSATQGPNPQDIATPEPEYIDIDLPELPRAPAPAPIHRSFTPQRSFSAPAPVHRNFNIPIQRQFAAPRPLPHPVISSYSAPLHHHHNQIQPASGHSYSAQSGYQYKRPVFIRRNFFHRYF